MNKIEQLEAQVKDLQAQIEAIKEENTSFKNKETPWVLANANEEGFAVSGKLSGEAIHSSRYAEDDLNSFSSEEIAQGFANAFRVMILLRQCEGAGKLDADGDGWATGSDGSVEWYQSPQSFMLCPPFPSDELALVAANSVGIENIKNAYKFLSNIKD